MRQIGAWMDEVVTALAKGDAEDVIARVHHEVSELTASSPPPASHNMPYPPHVAGGLQENAR